MPRFRGTAPATAPRMRRRAPALQLLMPGAPSPVRPRANRPPPGVSASTPPRQASLTSPSRANHPPPGASATVLDANFPHQPRPCHQAPARRQPPSRPELRDPRRLLLRRRRLRGGRRIGLGRGR